MGPNAQVVLRTIESFNSGDWAAFGDCIHEEAVYHDQSPTRNVDMPDVLVGRDALVTAMKEFRAPFRELRCELDELVEVGEQVVTSGRWVGTGEDSGIRTELFEAMLWTVRDGRFVEAFAFASLDEALEAAGRVPSS